MRNIQKLNEKLKREIETPSELVDEDVFDF